MIPFLQEFWQQILGVVGGVGALVLIAGWLIRTTVLHYLDKEKDRLRNDLEKEKDKHKAELDRIAFTHQTKFSRLHAEQAKIIAQLYRQIFDVREAIKHLGTASNRDEAQPRFEKFRESVYKASVYFERNRIYFGAKLAWQLVTLFHALQDLASDYYQSHGRLQEGERYAAFIEKIGNNNETIAASLDRMEEEFRSLLGVIEEK